MEKKLKALFEYQRFEENARLAKLISETENDYADELSDDALGLVNAAGELLSDEASSQSEKKRHKTIEDIS